MAYKRNILAFSLIEMSIVILIISLILSGVMTIQNQRLRVAKVAELNRKLDIISEALYQFRLVNNKLPCPANASVIITDADFGLQANGVDETCQTSSTGNTDLQSNINTLTNNVFGGSVPVRTLGLPDDIAFDPWGNRFTYYMDKTTNKSANMTGINGTDGVSLSGSLTTTDESTATTSTDIFAVVLSHGPNGHGSFAASGVREFNGSTNAQEWANCLCNATVAQAPLPSSLPIRVQRNLATGTTIVTTFDDVARPLPRAFFYTYAEKNP